MNPRLAKQLVYGGIFFTILFFVMIWIYVSAFKPAPSCFDGKLNQDEEQIDCGGSSCIDCAIRNLDRLTAMAEFVPISDTSNVVIRVTNPNIFYGAASFTYTLTLRDTAGNELTSLERDSFIYPGQFDRTIIEANLPASAFEVALPVEIVVSNPEWKSVQEFDRPETALRQRRVILSEDQTKVEISGILVNENPFMIQEVEVGALLHDNNGRLVSVSKTVLSNIEPFGERFFKVLVPALHVIDLNLNRTEVTVVAER